MPRPRARPAPGTRPGPGACPRCRRTRRRPAPSASRSPRNSADGFATSRRPAPPISKTPISSVAPKRFLAARRMRNGWPRSPSKESTASTMCSTTLGPAIWPSLVTWPTRTTAAPRCLAKRTSACARPRTWVTEPGAGFVRVGPQRLDRIDDDEIGALRLARAWRGCRATLVSAASATGASARPMRLGAQADLRGRLLAREVERAPPGAASAAATCSSSVDLPMPGSPPSRSAEPGTKPPPVTRSNSPMPVEKRRASVAACAGLRARRRVRARRARARSPAAGRRRSPRRSCSTRRRRRTSRPARGDRAAALANEVAFCALAMLRGPKPRVAH